SALHLNRMLVDNSSQPTPGVMEVFARGSLCWPSPFDGRALSTNCGLNIFDAVIMAYRVVDDEYGEVFYVICGTFGVAQLSAVYFPAHDAHFFDPQHDGKYGLGFELMFLNHVASFAIEIEHYLLQPKRRFALAFLEGQIGHHLWNELANMDQLAQRGD